MEPLVPHRHAFPMHVAGFEAGFTMVLRGFEEIHEGREGAQSCLTARSSLAPRPLPVFAKAYVPFRLTASDPLRAFSLVWFEIRGGV